MRRTLIATDIELTNTLTEAAPAPEPLSAPAPLQRPVDATGPVNGPSQGPTVSAPPQDEDSLNDAPPGSPYTANRAIIQNITLPTVPNFEIPPSPPGSPPRQSTAKFAQFLKLKERGQHFNQRLEGSSVLRDPGHLKRLLDFAGISEEEQYASSLAPDVAVPTVFPEWAYADQLKASQKQILKERDQRKSKAPRDGLEFVSATKSGVSSGAGTPLGNVSRQSAAEKDKAGLEDGQADRTASLMAEKRKGLEHRSRDSSQSRNRWRSRSRSPKRRRSNSRDRK
jgi:hypothetical protein